MIERERSATASGGLRNGFAEWVCRSGGFNEWVCRSGFEEWVFWVSGFWVEFEQEKMEGTTKLEGTTCRCFGHCSMNELSLGWVEDEFGFGWIRVK